jgi:hypothetical protein
VEAVGEGRQSGTSAGPSIRAWPDGVGRREERPSSKLALREEEKRREKTVTRSRISKAQTPHSKQKALQEMLRQRMRRNGRGIGAFFSDDHGKSYLRETIGVGRLLVLSGSTDGGNSSDTVSTDI